MRAVQELRYGLTKGDVFIDTFSEKGILLIHHYRFMSVSIYLLVAGNFKNECKYLQANRKTLDKSNLYNRFERKKNRCTINSSGISQRVTTDSFLQPSHKQLGCHIRHCVTRGYVFIFSVGAIV